MALTVSAIDQRTVGASAHSLALPIILPVMDQDAEFIVRFQLQVSYSRYVFKDYSNGITYFNRLSSGDVSSPSPVVKMTS